MQTARRRRGGRRRTGTWAIAASIAVHIVGGVAVWLQHPSLPLPSSETGPPEPIIPVLIMPKTPAAAGKPAPIRLHRRPQPFIPPQVTPAPIAPPAPKGEAPAAPPKLSVPAFHPAPQPEGPKDNLRATLRGSYVGCANPNATGLTKAERDACDEKLGKGAKDVGFAGLGLAPDKLRGLDAAAADKERALRERGAPPAAAATASKPGQSAESMADSMGVPPKPH